MADWSVVSEESARWAMAELSKDYVAHSPFGKKDLIVQTPLALKGGIKSADIVCALPPLPFNL